MPVKKVKSKWSGGSLQFYETSAATELLTIDSARIHELNEVPAYAYMSGVTKEPTNAYTIAPHSGTVVGIAGVCYSAVISGFTAYCTVSGVATGTLTFVTGAASGTAYSAAVSSPVDEYGVIRFYVSGVALTGVNEVNFLAMVRR